MIARLDLADALDGLHAYDVGAIDSGIHDERLRTWARAEVEGMAPKARRAWVSRLIYERYLALDAQELGYGPEEALEFLEWLRDEVPCAIIYERE